MASPWPGVWRILRRRLSDSAARSTSGVNRPFRGQKYVLTMFPYPSGDLHMGHVRVYTICDVLARYYRLEGYSVLCPMGWDSFGLPAENAARERNIDPAEWTDQNIESMRRQFDLLGCSFDWSKELRTSDPHYFKWTQWIFLQLFNAGLAYQKDAEVNWDPVDETVLANEQVDANGRSWRSGAVVERKMLKQWFLGITAYAEDLLQGLTTEIKAGKWPEQVLHLQGQWIGKSTGAVVRFQLAHDPNQTITVFTTRPETIYGASFIALSPEHDLVSALARRDLPDRHNNEILDEGLFLGAHAVHPMTGEALPIYAAKYVIGTYGEGAVMGVPAHDERDLEFAKAFELEVKQVVSNTGHLINSPSFNGLTCKEAADQIVEHLYKNGNGQAQITYKLRDWLVSRQRYWGTPIPIIHCPGCGAVPVPAKDLPVVQPSITGGRSTEYSEWLNVACPRCGTSAIRETDTLDTFVDSSWYFLRFCDPHNSSQAFAQEAIDHWIGKNGVNIYIGGIEHAILHLLYARFINMFLHRQGFIGNREPFEELITQGMVLGETAKELSSGRYLRNDEWNRESLRSKRGEDVEIVWEKMSKSKYNGVEPAQVIEKFGIDAVRLAILFAAPPDKSLEWREEAIQGQVRFLNRLADLVEEICEDARLDEVEMDRSVLPSVLNRAIISVSKQMQSGYSFNVAVAELMKLSNALGKAGSSDPLYVHTLKQLLVMLSPMAPNAAQELWRSYAAKLNLEQSSVHEQAWPVLVQESATTTPARIVVQVGGKKRGLVSVDGTVIADLDDSEIIQLVRHSEEIKGKLEHLKIKREILIRQKDANAFVLNFVV